MNVFFKIRDSAKSIKNFLVPTIRSCIVVLEELALYHGPLCSVTEEQE